MKTTKTKIIKCRLCDWTSEVPITSRRECCPKHAKEVAKRNAAKRRRLSRGSMHVVDGYRIREYSADYPERRAKIVACTDSTRRYSTVVKREEAGEDDIKCPICGKSMRQDGPRWFQDVACANFNCSFYQQPISRSCAQEMSEKIAAGLAAARREALEGAVGKAGELIARLEELKIGHYACEDCWYSCPKSKEGCCDERQEGCTCGADTHNAEVDSLIVAIRALAGPKEGSAHD